MKTCLVSQISSSIKILKFEFVWTWYVQLTSEIMLTRKVGVFDVWCHLCFIRLFYKTQEIQIDFFHEASQLCWGAQKYLQVCSENVSMHKKLGVGHSDSPISRMSLATHLDIHLIRWNLWIISTGKFSTYLNDQCFLSANFECQLKYQTDSESIWWQGQTLIT